MKYELYVLYIYIHIYIYEKCASANLIRVRFKLLEMVTEVWKFMYSLSLDIAEPNRYKKTKSNSLVLSINKQQKMQ